MSDLFYRFMRVVCRPPAWLASRPIILHGERLPMTGPVIVAPNHTSPYDVPCLIRSTPRLLDFLSIVEMERKPIVGRFYRAMNCIFTDRDKRDVKAARALRRRLEQQRAVVIFPEGHVRPPQNSVTRGAAFKPGVVRLAEQTGAPIIPCVLANTIGHSRPMNWLPFQRWSYGVIFGEPIHVGEGQVAATMEALSRAYIALSQELDSNM